MGGIRVVVTGIVQRGSEILVGKGEEGDTGRRFFRPLGGAVEPGETAEQALRRECREEIGVEPARTVRVVPYDESWPRIFAEVRDALIPVLSPACTAVHHVGSTSVPGLAAKPVIDVLVEARTLDQIDASTPDLERLGYRARGEYGIAGRRYFSRPADPTTPKVHLHVFEEGHERARGLLRLRDFLRSHPVHAGLYGALKVELARTYADDRDAYQAAKAPFIEVLADAAREHG